MGWVWAWRGASRHARAAEAARQPPGPPHHPVPCSPAPRGVGVERKQVQRPLERGRQLGRDDAQAGRGVLDDRIGVLAEIDGVCEDPVVVIPVSLGRLLHRRTGGVGRGGAGRGRAVGGRGRWAQQRACPRRLARRTPGSTPPAPPFPPTHSPARLVRVRPCKGLAPLAVQVHRQLAAGDLHVGKRGLGEGQMWSCSVGLKVRVWLRLRGGVGLKARSGVGSAWGGGAEAERARGGPLSRGPSRPTQLPHLDAEVFGRLGVGLQYVLHALPRLFGRLWVGRGGGGGERWAQHAGRQGTRARTHRPTAPPPLAAAPPPAPPPTPPNSSP